MHMEQNKYVGVKYKAGYLRLVAREKLSLEKSTMASTTSGMLNCDCSDVLRIEQCAQRPFKFCACNVGTCGTCVQTLLDMIVALYWQIDGSSTLVITSIFAS